MAKQAISATELVNTEVQFVSLVKRGANRIPFRITKEDDNMLDLHKIGRNLFKIADPAPAVVGAIVKKGADVAKVEALLKSAGIDATFKKTEHDDVVTLTKSDLPADTTSVLKVSEDVALVVTGLKKAFSGFDFTSWSFGDVMATEGYFVSICTAVDVLRSTVANIMMEATSPSEAAAAIGKATDELKGYLITLTGGLPVEAFKADVELSKPGAVAAEPAAKAEDKEDDKDEDEKDVEKSKAKADGKDSEDDEDDKDKDAKDEKDAEKAEASDDKEGDDSEDEDDAKKKQKAGEAEPAAKTDDAAKDTTKADGKELDEKESGAGATDTGPDAPKVKGDLAEVLASIETLKASLEGAIDGVRKDVNAISGRVEEVSTLAQKTDAALNGTVFNAEAGDPSASVKKAEAPKVIPLLDTAYERRHA